MEPALRRSYRKTSQRFWSMETLWRCCRTSWLTALTTQMLVTCMSFICIDITTIYCLLYILHLFWSHHHIMDKQCLCLSVCRPLWRLLCCMVAVSNPSIWLHRPWAHGPHLLYTSPMVQPEGVSIATVTPIGTGTLLVQLVRIKNNSWKLYSTKSIKYAV